MSESGQKLNYIWYSITFTHKGVLAKIFSKSFEKLNLNFNENIFGSYSFILSATGLHISKVSYKAKHLIRASGHYLFGAFSALKEFLECTGIPDIK